MPNPKMKSKAKKPIAAVKDLKSLIGTIARNLDARTHYLQLILQGKTEQQAARETLQYFKQRFGKGLGKW